MHFLIFHPKDMLNSCLHFNEPQPKHAIYSTFLYVVQRWNRSFDHAHKWEQIKELIELDT